MKNTIIDLIAQALHELEQASQIPTNLGRNIQLSSTKDPSQGDYATNIAMMLAKPAGMAPRELAQLIADKIAVADNIERVDVAGPGFINFFVASGTSQSVVATILE
ncbi:MAG: arginine--tRNA ligase, partial [Gammaproteobacteria bacterium]|nr:arginine--tRNA ligase [Gammaproteobacteria bacterium]